MKVINNAYSRYLITTARLISKKGIIGLSDKNEMCALYDQNNSYNVRDGLYISRALMSSGCVPSLDLRKTLALNLCTVDTRIFALLTLFQKPLFRKFEKRHIFSQF